MGFRESTASISYVLFIKKKKKKKKQKPHKFHKNIYFITQKKITSKWFKNMFKAM